MTHFIQFIKENKKAKQITVFTLSVFLAIVLIVVSVTAVNYRKNKVDIGSKVADTFAENTTEPIIGTEPTINQIETDETATKVQSKEETVATAEVTVSKTQNETTIKKPETTAKPETTTPARKYPKGNYKAGLINGSSVSQSEMDQVADVVLDFLDKYITDGMSEYDKARAAFDYIFSTCAYDQDLPNDTSNVYGALVKRRCDCWGYASAFQYLCVAMDMECYFVVPKNSVNDMHRFNVVKVDSVYYIVDVQSGRFLVSEGDYGKGQANEDTMKNYPRCTVTHPNCVMFSFP